MGIGRVRDVRAHAAGHVARIASLNRVAGEAARGLGARLDGMAHHEVSAVDLARLDLLRSSLLDGEILRDVVARLTLRLRVAALAELRLLALGHRRAMMPQERRIVLEEGRGHGAPQRFGLMTRCALPL